MAPTQDALYAEIDLELSWSERELPERERTKHVHRLHPYLGKFIPQLVEALLGRYVPARAGARSVRRIGDDARAVARERSGRRGCRHRGVQLPAHGGQDAALRPVALESELRDVVRRVEAFDGDWPLRPGTRPSGMRRAQPASCSRSRADRRVRAPTSFGSCWLAPPGRRAAPRTSTSTSRAPQSEPYWCHKHKRICRPVDRAEHFLRRYTIDTLARIKEFSRVRARGREAEVLHGDARGPYGGRFDGADVAAVPGADRLPRAASVRLRASGPRGQAGGRARRGGSRHERPALTEYVEGIAARARPEVAARPRSGRHRRERQARALSAHPRSGGPAARGPASAAREPPDRQAGRRVLRGHPDRPLAPLSARNRHSRVRV